MNRWRRLALVLVFVTGALGLCVAGAATSEQRWPYPTATDLGTDYEAHVGEEIFFTGGVESVVDNGLRIRIEGDAGPVLLDVSGTDAAVEPGGVVQVTGTLQPEQRVQASTVVVVNPSSGAELGKFAISGVGALVFLGLFFREWRIDVRDLVLEGRRHG